MLMRDMIHELCPSVRLSRSDIISKQFNISSYFLQHNMIEQEVKVIWQKAPRGGPIPRLGVTPGSRNLYNWIPGVGFPISVP